MATPGRTHGRPNSPFGVKWYFKPSMGRVIGRIPGVVRKSASVLAVNEVLENLAGQANHPATQCGGKAWKDFITCLRQKMKALNIKSHVVSRAPQIAEQYGIPVSTKKTPRYLQVGRT